MEQEFSRIPASRRQNIIEYVKTMGSAQVKPLAEYLNVSEATARRDLDTLASQGLLERTHGGAILKKDDTSSFEYKHEEKMIIMKEEKRKIAVMAASFIHAGDTILLDTGSTNFYLARELSKIPNLTVITYDLFIANNILLHPTSTLIVTGGIRRQGYNNVLWGNMVEDYIRTIHVDKAFLGADAVDLNFGISNTNVLEASIKKLLIKAGKEVILLIDHSKLHRTALVKVCELADIDRLIIDRQIDENSLDLLKEKIKYIHLV